MCPKGLCNNQKAQLRFIFVHSKPKNKHVRSQSERGLLCITVRLPLLASAGGVAISVGQSERVEHFGDVLHSIAVRSNLIAIML